MQRPHLQNNVHTKHLNTSRREFLEKTAFLACGTLAFGLPFPAGRRHQAFAAPAPHSTGIRYALELQGNFAGPLIDVQSGFVSGQVVTQSLGPTQQLKKHLATIVHEDITIQCGNDMSPSLFQWIQQTLNGGSPSPLNGAILTTNAMNQVIDRKEFQNALLTEITFPALDRSSNLRVFMDLTIKPGQTILQPGTGAQISFPSPHQFPLWMASNFRLSIQNLEQACPSVTKIDALVWKQQVGQGLVGTARGSGQSTGSSIEMPNLVITLPQSQAEPFTQWFREFVIQGQAADSQERPGLLEFLGPDLQTPFMSLSFGHLGIFRMSPVPNLPASGIPQVQIEMYCETMQLTQLPGGGSSATQSLAPPTQPKAPPPQPKTLIQPPTKNLTPRLPLKR